MRLYHNVRSGHAHRARLFLSLLDVPAEIVEVDLAGRANRSPAFLALNPFGQVPVLDDDGTIVADANAILVYLAKKFGRDDWLPDTPIGAARVQRWLSVAAGPIAFGPAAARLVRVFGATFDEKEVVARAHAILERIEENLVSGDWMAADAPTIADVALYSYVARAPEGGVTLDPYPRVRAWLTRIEALPGFVPFAPSVA